MARRTLASIVASSIRRLRDEQRVSARELAERCAALGMPSLTRGVIAKIESGRRGIEVDEMNIFAAALGVSFEALTTETALTILHLSDLGLGPQRIFGQPADQQNAAELLTADLDEIDRQLDGAHPDLVVVTGDLGSTGRPREYDLVRTFLERLATHLGLGFDRIAIIPGDRDVNLAATEGYFAECDADDVTPQEPYWSNWRRFATLFGAWPDEGRAVRMHAEQPWSLYEIKDLRVVVAGLNSTVRDSPRRADHSGAVGEEQVGWFASALDAFESQGWFRLGLVHHNPLAAGELADADLLDRELGARFNLLLHGNDTAAQIGHLPSGTLTLGAGTPADGGSGTAANRYQLIRISTTGLVRTVRRFDLDERAWRPDGNAATLSWSIPVVQAWHRASATFPPLTAGPGRELATAPVWQVPGSGWVAGDATEQEIPQVLDARQLLLDRVADVCQAQHASAVVKRIKGRPPYLWVTYEKDGQALQMRIGGCVGDVTAKVIDDFQARVHHADPGLSLVLVHQGSEPAADLRHYASRRNIRLASFLQFQGLVDLSEYVEAQSRRLAADPRYPPESYVSHRYVDALDPQNTERQDVVEELLAQVSADDGRFVLLLGDFGRGKTFALRELARRIPAEYPHLVPILIDLRALDKSQSLDAHVAAHLAERGHDDIDMRALRYMLHEGRIVLIFDGFDELVARATYDRAADHLATLLSGMVDAAKIVVASRTQHFQTHNQVLTAMGAQIGRLPQRRILSLSELSDEQIRELLGHRYGNNADAVARRVELLSSIPGLLALAQNPRMLTFIADLDDERLHAVAVSGGRISPAGLYEQILDHWLTHEEQRTQAIKGVPIGFRLSDLWLAVTTLALRMWESEELLVGVDELGVVARTLLELSDSYLTTEQIVYAVGSGSLLVRTDDGMFGFIHESVMEWLVAKRIAEQLAVDVRQPLLERRVLSTLTIDFLCGLAEVALLKGWAHTVITGTAAGSSGVGTVGRTNASRILARLSSSTGLHLRYALLSNEDLSDREWPEADLTGANLDRARMANMNLRGAVLRGARLVGATLEDTDLTGADLSGADLTAARLTNAVLADCDLTGAKLNDARLIVTDLSGATTERVEWRRAALVNVIARPEVLDGARGGGAVVVPGQQVETATYPPSLGVRFGFEEGRLPRPVAYDADGALLAVGNEDGSILICDAHDGTPIRTLVGHEWRAYTVMFSPNRPVLASGSLDGTVRLWDANTGDCRYVLRVGPGWVWPMLFNADGSLLAAGSKDGVVRIWDVDSGELRQQLAGHTAPVWTATFDNGGRYLATGDDAGRARLWNARDGSLIRNLDSDGRRTFWMRFDKDGTRLAGGFEDGLLRLWSPERSAPDHRLTGHQAAVYALDFHPDGRSIVSADVAGHVRRWDVTGPQPTGRELDRHTGAVYRITFSPDRTLFATGDSDGAVWLWDAETGAIVRQLGRHHASVWPMMFRPDGAQLATSSNDYTVQLWDTHTGQNLHVMRGHGRRMEAVVFNTDGTVLATSGNDGVIRLWDPVTGRCTAVLRHSPNLLISAVFSPNTSEIATASNDGRIYLWDIESLGNGDVVAREGRVIDPTTDDLWATVYDPIGENLATANDDNKIQIIIKATGRVVRTLDAGGGRARALAFSPGGEQLAAAGDDHRVRLWRWRTEDEPAILESHHGRVFSLAYSPDGTLLVTAGHDGRIIIWDSATGAVRKTLTASRGKLWAVSFHPGGELLATAGDEEVIDIWSVRTGEHLHELRGHTRRVWSVAFSPNGTVLASSSTDGTVRLWRIGADGSGEHQATLLGLPNGWAAFTPTGRYKAAGEVQGHFWHAVGMSRFEPGELGRFIPELREIEPGAPLL